MKKELPYIVCGVHRETLELIYPYNGNAVMLFESVEKGIKRLFASGIDKQRHCLCYMQLTLPQLEKDIDGKHRLDVMFDVNALKINHGDLFTVSDELVSKVFYKSFDLPSKKEKQYSQHVLYGIIVISPNDCLNFTLEKQPCKDYPFGMIEVHPDPLLIFNKTYEAAPYNNEDFDREAILTPFTCKEVETIDGKYYVAKDLFYTKAKQMIDLRNRVNQVLPWKRSKVWQ